MILAPILGRRVDPGDSVTPHPHRDGLRTRAGLHLCRAGRTGHAGSHCHTVAASAVVINAAGNFLGWGVVVPLYAVAILTTRALPRWIGWLGLLVGALAGWLGLLSPASSVIASISNIGFIGFFVFMLSMGIALLRRRSKVDEVTQASAQKLN
jgi:hypothetical protein